MSIRNHSVYEVDVEFTAIIQHRDEFGDRTGEETEKPSQKTFRVVAPKYNEEIARAWVAGEMKHRDPEFKVIAVRQVELSAFIEERTY